MHLFGTFFIYVLTALFLVGLAGSVVVVLISFVEDFQELLGPDEPIEKSGVPPGSGAMSNSAVYAPPKSQ